MKLHYIRTKDGAEVDFALSLKSQLTHLVKCKLSDPNPTAHCCALPANNPKPKRYRCCVICRTAMRWAKFR